MANIILGEDFSIRAVKVESDSYYELADISFYVSKNLRGIPFVVITGDNGIVDICRASFIGENGNYSIHHVDYATKLRIKNGKCNVKLILVGEDSCRTSDGVDMSVTVNNYALSHQLYITSEINSNVKELYNKIVELTKVNIELYEKMNSEVDEK